MSVEEEGNPRRELVDAESGSQRRIHISNGIRKSERDFLDRGGARLANVIAANRDRIPVRNVARAKGKRVGNQAQRRFWRKNVCATRDVLFQNIVLNRAVDFCEGHALLSGNRQVKAQQNRRGRVNCHRSRNFIEWNTFEQPQHVFQRIDRHADFAHFAGRQRIVRVQTNLGRQIKRD